MIDVSDEYKKAITDNSETARFYAEFGFIPPYSRDNVQILYKNFGQFNNFNQIKNKKYTMGAKWGSLELNRAVLGDGTEYPNKVETRQTGEWSLTQSDENGILEDNFITYKMQDEFDLIGITAYFDDKGLEWATELIVDYLNSDDIVIASKTFENNSAIALVDFPYDNVRSIRLRLIKWNYPNRFAKICQIVPGQLKYFTENDIFSFELKENIKIFEELEIPYNKLVFDNSSNEYNIINPDSLVSKLIEGMEFTTSVGVDINIDEEIETEFVNTGNWFLVLWNNIADDEIRLV